MRILIVGAGALGGTVGAYLTRAGEDVVLLDVNTARARHLNESGLLITRVGEDEVCYRVTVVTSIDSLAPFELVLIAVKTYQTEQAVADALPATGRATWFLSLQNGVGSADAIAKAVGAERVLCGITYHSAQHAGPGRLHFRMGVKPIQIAPYVGAITPEIEAIGETFRRAGLDTNVVPNIDHVIWQKLLHNAVVNPVSALTGLTCREILGDDDLLTFMRSLCGEIVVVMRARGIPIVDEEDPFRPVMGSLKALGKNRPTMWQDLARGKRTEIDALNGAVVAEAQRLGLTAVHNAALVNFVHSRERQKFLNRQEIARKLGLEPGAKAATTDAAPVSAPMLRAKDGGMTPAGPPLKTTPYLKSLISRYYRDLERASDDPDRLVAACSGLAPVEIVRALGLAPYFPEHHAALIGATRKAAPYIARATEMGFSQFASSAMRADIGALLDKSSPLVIAHELRGPPRPDVVVYSTNTGHELLRWFEFYGSHYDVPVVGLHPPPALGDLEQIDVDAAVDQILRLVTRLEGVSGRHLEMDRLGEAVQWSEEATNLWEEILRMAQATPAPLTTFDLLVHLAPMVLLRGTPEAVAYYRELRDELNDRIESGIAAVESETHRFYWDGPPIWCALRPLSRLFADHGIAIVASTFTSVFTLPGLDPSDPIESMARAYTGVFGNRSEAYKTSWLARQFGEFGVDGAVFHDCRTTPEASHVRYGLAVRSQQLTGVPSLVIEADSHDLRLFSTERLERQLGEFVERHLAVAVP